MKRFDVLGLGFIICVASLPSCIHINSFTVRSKPPGVQEQHNEESVEQLTDDSTAPSKLALSSFLEKSATIQAPTKSKVSNAASINYSATDSSNTHESSDATSTSDENIHSERTSELLQTLFEEDANKSPPPTPLPDGENPQPILVSQAGSLTLEDLEQMALEFNPTLQQSAAVVDKGRGIHQQVGLYPNPTIGYSGEEAGDAGTAGKQGGFVSQTIVTAGKLRLNQEVAAWKIEGLSWEYQAQRYRVLNDVQLQFYDVLGSQRRLQLATELVKVAEEGVNAAEALFEAKQGARPDVLQAKVDLNAVRIILQNTRYEYEADWKQLAGFVGRADLDLVQLAGELQAEPKVWDWQTTYQMLLSDSPELQAALTRVQQARTQIRRQEVQPIPNLLTGVGVAHDYASGDNVANVQLGIPLPIFNRNQGNIAIAQAEYNRAIRDVERLRLNLRNRLAVAFRDFQQATQQVERYQQDILPTAQENLDLTEEGYKQGEFDFLRVLTARRTYFQTNLQYVSSQIALRQADVVLSGLLLTGGLNDVVNPGVGAGVLGGVGQRGQTLEGQ